MSNPPAGWYDDPADSGNSERFWDGDQWTEQVRPVAPPEPAPAPPPPAPAQAAPVQAQAQDPVPPPAPASADSGFGVEAPVTRDSAGNGALTGDATAVMPAGGGYDLPDAETGLPPAPGVGGVGGVGDVSVPPAPGVGGVGDVSVPPAPGVGGVGDVSVPPAPGVGGVGLGDVSVPPVPDVEVPSASDVVAEAAAVAPAVPGQGDLPPAPGFGQEQAESAPPAPGFGADGGAGAPPAPGFGADGGAGAPPAPGFGADGGPGILPGAEPAGVPPAPVGSVAPVGAGGFAGIRTDLLTDEQYAERDTNERVTLQNAKMLKVELGADVLARQGSMVAFQGSVDFDYEGSGGVGKFLKKAVTGEGLPLMRCTGQGEVFLADAANDIHIIHLEGAALTVNGKNILAFEPSLKWDIERLKGVGVVSGGLFNTRLEGHGWVAITTDGPPVVLKTDQATFADADAAVAWSANLTTSINSTFKGKALLGRGSGETFQLAFQGQGIVIIQPSEGQQVPPHSH